MTDTTKRSRVKAGVPTGGEFATEPKTETDDLDATPDPLEGFVVNRLNGNHWHVYKAGHYDGHPLYVETVGDQFGVWNQGRFGEENATALRKLRAAGVNGDLTVFETNAHGSWIGCVQMPDDNYLVVQSGGDLGDTIMVNIARRPVDETPLASGSDTDKPLADVLDHMVFTAAMVEGMRKKYPRGRISSPWHEIDRKCLLIGAPNGVGIVVKMTEDENKGTVGNWYPLQESLPRGMDNWQAWDRAAELVGVYDWSPLATELRHTGEDARKSMGTRWLEDGRA